MCPSRITITGGDKIRGALMRLGKNTPILRIGILEGATYSGEPDTGEKPGQSVATVAFWQEYGTSRGTPPRPFMRNTVAEKKEEWARQLSASLLYGRDFRQALEAVGMVAVQDMRQTIQKGVPPSSAPSTIAFKKRIGKEYANTPLILTSTMLRSIAYEVVDEHERS